MSSAPNPRVFDTGRRDTIIAIVVGIALVAFIVAAIVITFERVGKRGIHGVIERKFFVVEPETRFTVGGKSGLKKEEIEGQYRFEVKDKISGRVYVIAVSKEVFGKHEEGQDFYFVGPD